MALPTGVKKVIFPLGILFLFGSTWFGLYKPEIEKIGKYRAQPEAARRQIEDMVRQLSTFNVPTEEEHKSWSELESKLVQRIPSGRQITELYASLSEMAELYRLQNFKRTELPAPSETFTEGGITRSGFDLELTFDCEYASLVSFLNGLRNMERLIEVLRLEVTRKLPSVGVRLVIRSYYFP